MTLLKKKGERWRILSLRGGSLNIQLERRAQIFRSRSPWVRVQTVGSVQWQITAGCAARTSSVQFLCQDNQLCLEPELSGKTFAFHAQRSELDPQLQRRKRDEEGRTNPMYNTACEGLVWKNGTMLSDKQMVALG